MKKWLITSSLLLSFLVFMSCSDPKKTNHDGPKGPPPHERPDNKGPKGGPNHDGPKGPPPQHERPDHKDGPKGAPCDCSQPANNLEAPATETSV